VTSYRTMLDTNIVSDLIRNPHGVAAGRLRQHGTDGLCISIVVAAELRFGCFKRRSAQLLRRVEAMLSAVDVLPFDAPADRDYGRIRAELEASGRPIGPNDQFIAAHAICLGVTLATDNVAEFRRVAGLRVENWLA
jgi:tRNA(fMet)-specific endonuclease VapC